LKRIYHHYSKWEETPMWKTVSREQEKILLQKAIEFTGNAKLYGKYMLKAIKLWVISCEHNLTCNGINKQAWIGHAACYIAIECPEYITRLAWRHLTQEQQDEANKMADKAIKLWERNYAKK